MLESAGFRPHGPTAGPCLFHKAGGCFAQVERRKERALFLGRPGGGQPLLWPFPTPAALGFTHRGFGNFAQMFLAHSRSGPSTEGQTPTSSTPSRGSQILAA